MGSLGLGDSMNDALVERFWSIIQHLSGKGGGTGAGGTKGGEDPSSRPLVVPRPGAKVWRGLWRECTKTSHCVTVNPRMALLHRNGSLSTCPGLKCLSPSIQIPGLALTNTREYAKKLDEDLLGEGLPPPPPLPTAPAAAGGRRREEEEDDRRRDRRRSRCGALVWTQRDVDDNTEGGQGNIRYGM